MELSIQGILTSAAEGKEQEYAAKVAEHVIDISKSYSNNDLGLDNDNLSTVYAFLKAMAEVMAASSYVAMTMAGRLQDDADQESYTHTISHLMFANLLAFLRETN